MPPSPERYRDHQEANLAWPNRPCACSVAYRDIDAVPATIDAASVEKDLVFAGLLGMIDPRARKP